VLAKRWFKKGVNRIMQDVYKIFLIVVLHIILLGYAFYGARASSLVQKIKIFMGIGALMFFVFIYLLIWLQQIGIINRASSIINHMMFLILYVPAFSLYYSFRRKKIKERSD